MTFDEVVTQVRKLSPRAQQHIADEIVKLAFEQAFDQSTTGKRTAKRRTAKATRRTPQKASGSQTRGRTLFLEWAENMSWPETAERVGVAMRTIYNIRDNKGAPLKPVRQKIEKATKGKIPADMPW